MIAASGSRIRGSMSRSAAVAKDVHRHHFARTLGAERNLPQHIRYITTASE